MVATLRAIEVELSEMVELQASGSGWFAEKFGTISMRKNRTRSGNHQAMAMRSWRIERATEAYGKGANDFKATKRFADDFMPHILNLYGSSATPRDFEIYAPDASFEDPLTRAYGVKEIKSAFYSKVFSESRIVEYTVKEERISPRKREIIVDCKQYCKFLGRDIDLESLIKLYVVEGKIVRHEDRWNKKPLLSRETITLPMVGRVLEMTRRCTMLATHAMMGFGKD